MPPWVFLIA